MKRIEFGEDMNEVSGLGGFYERCCRTAIVAGATWCIENKAFDAEEVESAMRRAYVAQDDGQKVPLESELTPTQFALAMYHVRYIADNGWKKYTEQMSVPPLIIDEDVA
jgi:hypothetical protein